jgi:hypothetical protein
MRLLLAAFLPAAWIIPHPLVAQEAAPNVKNSPQTVRICRHPSCPSCLIAETANFRIL